MANIAIIIRKLIFKLGDTDLGATFRAVDTDNSGFITMGELEALLYRYFSQSELTKQEVLTIMRYFDRDRSGKIDYQEFVDKINNPDVDNFAVGGADAGYGDVVAAAEFEDVETKNTKKSVDHFHKKAKMGEPQAKLLQMFRVGDDQLTGQLPFRKVFGLLVDVTGLAQSDAERVMDYYFPGMRRTPTKAITYSQFSNMIKTRND